MSQLRPPYPALSLLLAFGLSPLAQGALQPPKETLFSMQKAEKIAIKAFAGELEGKELEQIHGRWVYSFDIQGRDHRIHEIRVDAKTGKVLSQKTETLTQEAAERVVDNGKG